MSGPAIIRKGPPGSQPSREATRRSPLPGRAVVVFMRRLPPSGLRGAGNAAKWIFHANTIIVLAVVQVLRVKSGATQFARGGDDRGVVVADPVSGTQVEGGFKKSHR